MRILKNIMDINKFNEQEFIDLDIGIEIQSFPQHILDDEGYLELIKEYKTKLKNFPNIIGLHGSSFDLNPGSTDKRIIEVTKFRYKQSIEIAKELGATYVVFHSQLNPLISVKRIREMKLNNQIEFWKDLLLEIEDTEIVLLLENEYDSSYEELRYIVESVNSHKLKVCIDVGHVLAYSQNSLRDWFINLKDYVEYIHLHWNDTKCDSHSIPSKDNISEIKSIFKEANISPIVTLEYGVEDLKSEISKIRTN